MKKYITLFATLSLVIGCKALKNGTALYSMANGQTYVTKGHRFPEPASSYSFYKTYENTMGVFGSTNEAAESSLMGHVMMKSDSTYYIVTGAYSSANRYDIYEAVPDTIKGKVVFRKK